jgi:hypothetical protein
MTDIFTETIFDYNLTFAEREILHLNTFDEILYFQNTSYQKRLSDLHFLFLICKDVQNRLRIIKAIKQLDKFDIEEIFAKPHRETVF